MILQPLLPISRPRFQRRLLQTLVQNADFRQIHLPTIRQKSILIDTEQPPRTCFSGKNSGSVKTAVVEHKGGMRPWCFRGRSGCSRYGWGGMHFGEGASRPGCTRFLPLEPSQTAAAVTLPVERWSAWPSEQSGFLRRQTREFKTQRGSAASHHQRHSSATPWNRNYRDAARNW